MELATRLCALFLVLLLLRLLLPLAGLAVVRVAVVLQLRSWLPLAHSRRRRRRRGNRHLLMLLLLPLLLQRRLDRRVGGRRHLEDAE